MMFPFAIWTRALKLPGDRWFQGRRGIAITNSPGRPGASTAWAPGDQATSPLLTPWRLGLLVGDAAVAGGSGVSEFGSERAASQFRRPLDRAEGRRLGTSAS